MLGIFRKKEQNIERTPLSTAERLKMAETKVKEADARMTALGQRAAGIHLRRRFIEKAVARPNS